MDYVSKRMLYNVQTNSTCHTTTWPDTLLHELKVVFPSWSQIDADAFLCIKRFYLFIYLFIFIFIVTLTNAEATYSAVGSFRRWSDAKGNCNNDGKFLAKIKNLQELKEARNVFIQHQDPKYWVGVKFDSSKNEFVWADGTEAPSNANFDAIVNKNDQLSQGYTKRCMFITNQDTLVADDCEQHYNYICQVGENDDAAEMTSKQKRKDLVAFIRIAIDLRQKRPYFFLLNMDKIIPNRIEHYFCFMV